MSGRRTITRRGFLACTAVASIVPVAGARPAATPSLVLRGGRLLRAGLPPVIGDVVVADGKVQSVGAGGGGATTIDAKGKIVTAGLTDPVTQTGLVEVSLEDSSKDSSHHDPDLIRAAFRAADGYNPASAHIPVTRMGGVTSVGVVPTGGLVSGLGAWADLIGDVPAEAIVDAAVAMHATLEVRGSHGGESSASRGTALLRLRELFDDATAFKRNPNAFQRRQIKRYGTSRLDLIATVRALTGRIPVVFHVDRASDILAALDLAKTYGLRPVLASAAEGWKVAEHVARAKAPVFVNPLDSGPMSFSARYAREDNAALLHRAGVKVSFTTGETHNVRKLRQLAGNAVRAGMPKDAALAAVTRNPAEALGMADRYGTVQRGMVANLVVWSGDPFELSTRVEAVIVHGTPLPLRSRQTALFERYR